MFAIRLDGVDVISLGAVLEPERLPFELDAVPTVFHSKGLPGSQKHIKNNKRITKVGDEKKNWVK